MTRKCEHDLPNMPFGDLVAEMARAVYVMGAPGPMKSEAQAYAYDLQVEITRRWAEVEKR
jgi:hypothetical protein